jgi:hypothetical protein
LHFQIKWYFQKKFVLNQDNIQLLQQDFVICKNYLRKVALTIINEGISKYPIFIAMNSDIDLDLGVPIIRQEELGTNFTYNASHLEDFVNKDIVSVEKSPVFIENYKNAEKFCCLLLSENKDASFVFIPYDSETVWEPKNREELN